MLQSLNGIEYQLAQMLTHDVAYHCRISDKPLTRVDVIVSRLHGQTAVSCVCDRVNNWLYTASTRRTDGVPIRINNLVDAIDPYRLDATDRDSVPAPYILLERRTEALDWPYGQTGIACAFPREACDSVDEQFYHALHAAAAHAPDADVGRHLIDDVLRLI